MHLVPFPTRYRRRCDTLADAACAAVVERCAQYPARCRRAAHRQAQVAARARWRDWRERARPGAGSSEAAIASSFADASSAEWC